MSNADKEKLRAQSGPQFSNMTAEQLEGDSEDDDEDETAGGDKPKSKIVKKKTGGSGRRRIDIKFIENKSRRQVTFSRRKRGLMKKVSIFLFVSIIAIIHFRAFSLIIMTLLDT